MNSTDEGRRISFDMLEKHAKGARRRLTGRFDVEAVQRTPCIGDVVDPLGYRSVSPIYSVRRGEVTFSGCATIMWQSMNIPGTPLDIHESTGAPNVLVRTKGSL